MSSEPTTAGANPSVSENAAEQGWPPATQAWYAVGVFTLVLMFNFLDRGIVQLLIGPLKADLQLSDQQIGLLMGVAFAIFYAVLGLPIARLVDSRSRRLIIGVGIATWSLMTAVCGLARNFPQLFLARMGVGVGEACNGPAVYSMMADYFPPNRLPRAIAVLQLGFVSGQGIALIVGGAVVFYFSQQPEYVLPLVGTLKPWQVTFIVVGAPGLLIALLLATVKEPPRRGRISAGPVKQAMPLKDVVTFLRANGATYGPMFLGLAVNTIQSFGAQLWTPEFFARTYGWDRAHAGVATGIVLVCVAPFGLFLGSTLAEAFQKRGYADANLRVLLIAMVIHIPGFILMPLMPTPELALVLYGFNYFVAMIGPAAQNAALQIITPNEMRGQVTALYLLVFNLIGFGLGPWVIGLLTDAFFGEPNLRYSLALTAAVMGPLASFIIWRGMKPYAQSVIRARAWS
jgi:MFS family permease